MKFKAHVRFESGGRVDVDLDCCNAPLALMALGKEMPKQYPKEKIVALTFKENWECVRNLSTEKSGK